MSNQQIIHSCCIAAMKQLPSCSIGAIVTDPPYEIGFMNKKWDGSGIAYNQAVWKEALRVCKPGAFLMAFGGTRTAHRMAVAIEDAGWVCRDYIEWVYASGFPKAQDITKHMDKMEGVERKVVGKNKNHRESDALFELGFQGGKSNGDITAPSSDSAKTWTGYKTPALKPAHEPIYIFQKPMIDEGAPQKLDMAASFFYCCKTSTKERNIGCDHLPLKATDTRTDTGKGSFTEKGIAPAKNNHPCLKPVKLLQYLMKLVAPPEAYRSDFTILDPFMGSGSGGMAAKGLDMNYIGIELDASYCDIARARIDAYES